MSKLAVRRTEGISRILILVFGLSLLLLGLLTVYSADDYWYSTFLSDGLQPWIQKMVYHYTTVNGRTFVHLWATVILHFGRCFFALTLIATGLLTGFSLWSENIQMRSIFLALFLGGLVLTPRQIMVQGILWISGFCNYFIPTAMVAILFRSTHRMIVRNTFTLSTALGLTILSFLCGATTEQIGLSSCALLALLVLEAWSSGNIAAIKLGVVELAAVVAGVATIFLSPATQARMSRETAVPLKKLISKALVDQGQLVQGCTALVFLISLIPILLYFTYPQTKRTLPVLLCSIFTETCLMGLLFRGEKTMGICYGGVLLGLTLHAVFCWFNQSKEIGALLCFACSTVAAMLFTHSSGYRSLLPMEIILLALTCRLVLEQRIIKGPVFHRSILLFVAVFVAGHMFHDVPHYIENVKVDHLNHIYARIAETGNTLYYCMDYNEEYTHLKAYSTGYFATTYLESLSLEQSSSSIYFYSSQLPLVRVNGQRATSPAIQDDHGNWLLPLRDIVEGMGGSLSWDSDSGISIVLHGQQYYLYDKSNGREFLWYDSSGKHTLAFSQNQSHSHYSICLPVQVYTKLFNLNVRIGDRAIIVS